MDNSSALLKLAPSYEFAQYSPEVAVRFQNLSPSDKRALEDFGTGGGTFNSLARHVAEAMHRADIDEETAREEMVSTYSEEYEERDTDRDVRRAIDAAYHQSRSTSRKSNFKLHAFGPSEIVGNVKAILESKVEELGESSDSVKLTTKELLPILYGNDLEALVCMGQSNSSFNTLPLSEWLKKENEDLECYQLRVLNPMSKLMGLTQQGKESEHSLDNSADELEQITYESDDVALTEDEKLKVIAFIGLFLPLISVCRSGNKSLHATFSLIGLPDTLKIRVLNWLVSRGADPAALTLHQFIRTPNATRNDPKARGVKQTLLYLDHAKIGMSVHINGLAKIGIHPEGDDLVVTESEESERFCEFLAGDYLHLLGLGWMRWTGIRWELIDRRLMLNAARAFQKTASIGMEFKRAKMLGRKSTMENIITLSEPAISQDLKAESLNAKPDTLVVENGTINLKEGVEGFRESQKAELMTKCLGVDFDRSADCPTWEAFLERIFKTHPEVLPYLQRVCGYMLTGHVIEQVFFFLFGDGCNGKSKFIETLEALMGELATKVPKAAYAQTRAGKTDVAISHLQGARLAVGEELNEREHLSEGILKTHTGGDRLQGRWLHGREFEFDPSHKFVMFGNHKPRITGTDEGIWRRLHFIPFLEKISDAEKDLRMGEKLKAELPGILNWALEGAVEWYEKGLCPPAVVTDANNSYRKEEDFIAQFLEECFNQEDPSARATRDALYSAYSRWCMEDNANAMTKKNFLAAVRQHGVTESDRRFHGAIRLNILPALGMNEEDLDLE